MLERRLRESRRLRTQARAAAPSCSPPRTKMRTSPRVDLEADERRTLFRNDDPEIDEEGGMQSLVQTTIVDRAEAESSLTMMMSEEDDPLGLLYLIPGAIDGGGALGSDPSPLQTIDSEDGEDDFAADQLSMFAMLCNESADVLFDADFAIDAN